MNNRIHTITTWRWVFIKSVGMGTQILRMVTYIWYLRALLPHLFVRSWSKPLKKRSIRISSIWCKIIWASLHLFSLIFLLFSFFIICFTLRSCQHILQSYFYEYDTEIRSSLIYQVPVNAYDQLLAVTKFIFVI